MGAVANQQEYNKENGMFLEGAYSQTESATNLKKASLFFFTLSILLTLIIAACVLYEVTNNRIHVLPYDGSSEILVHESKGEIGFLSVFLTGSLTLLLCTLIGGMLFFKRSILIPLGITGDIVQQMTEGHLNKPIQIKADDEIGQVADGINSLAINMQEVLLYIWNHTQQNGILLDHISEQLKDNPDSVSTPSGIKDDVGQLRRENEELRDIVTTFDYFEVKLEHEKMVSDPLHDPNQSKA